MKALARVAHEPGALEMCSIPDPDPGPGEVVIAVAAAGLCGSDLEAYHQRLASTTPLPRVPGHEFSGRIIALDVGVEGWSVGDHVVSETAAYVCGTCVFCRSDQYNLCPWRRGFGFGVDGAFAPYVRVPVRCLHRVPDSLPLLLAALTEPTCVTYNAVVEKSTVAPGDLVVVVGSGAIGLLALQWARSRGADVALVYEYEPLAAGMRIKTAAGFGEAVPAGLLTEPSSDLGDYAVKRLLQRRHPLVECANPGSQVVGL